MNLKNLAIFFTLIFWPLGLVLHNQNTELFTFIVPTILLVVAYRYYKQECWYYIPTLLLIGILSPKLVLLPPLYFILEYFSRNSIAQSKLVLGIVVSIIVLFFNWNAFKGQTIVTPDYEAEQLVIRNQQLYPTPLTARIFHNKWRIVGDKFVDNFFQLTDPNNYFFGFAPRQVIGNQNLQKFPFLAIIPFLYGLYYLNVASSSSRSGYLLPALLREQNPSEAENYSHSSSISRSRFSAKGDKSKDKMFIGTSITAAIINLSLLTTFDKNDFILYTPLTILIVYGLTKLPANKLSVKAYFLVFVAFSSIEFIRIFAL